MNSTTQADIVRLTIVAVLVIASIILTFNDLEIPEILMLSITQIVSYYFGLKSMNGGERGE